ncbi:hypothetical protein LTS18_001979, partial [Coniosporium uncinatum]
MSTAANTQAPPGKKEQSAIQRGYLLLYNGISATLWFSVLGRLLLLMLLTGWKLVFPQTVGLVKVTQTLALLEVVHSALATTTSTHSHDPPSLTLHPGLVRAPLLTTLMQISSRLLLIWLIASPFPNTVRASPFYTSMLLAWSLTEVIRYAYFCFLLSPSNSLGAEGVPPNLSWLRYNTFFVLYPLGI